jgi:HEAT repeats/Putative zinc-finger
MTCEEVRESLSLYLYGELDFATEELVEQHLHLCSACASALGQERSWHAASLSHEVEVPLDLLSKCRLQLRDSVEVARDASEPVWVRWIDSLGLRPSSWSMRLATASLLICLGFGVSRLLERAEIIDPYQVGGFSAQMGFVNPARARVRYIKPLGPGRVQLVVDEIRERSFEGDSSDQRIAQLLLAASKDPTDPALRAESIGILNSQPGDEVRDALLDSIKHDPNAGVRLKALEGLSRFADDAETRHALSFVLSHDDNPDVRMQAINLLVPPGDMSFSAELAGTLQQVMRSERNDYIRTRCRNALQAMNASVDIY